MALDNPDFSAAASSGGVATVQAIVRNTTGPLIAVGGATMFVVGGTTVNGAILQAQASIDGVSYNAIRGLTFDGNGVREQFNLSIPGVYYLAVAGYKFIRFQEIGGVSDANLVAAALFGPWQLPVAGQHQMANSWPVVLASNQSPVPVGLGGGATSDDTVLSAPFAVQLAGAANLVLVAGVALQKVYCLELNLYVVTAAVVLVQLQDTGGLVLGDIRTDAIMAQPRSLRGVSSGVGNGIRLLNTNGGVASGTLAGELVYVQK